VLLPMDVTAHLVDLDVAPWVAQIPMHQPLQKGSARYPILRTYPCKHQPTRVACTCAAWESYVRHPNELYPISNIACSIRGTYRVPYGPARRAISPAPRFSIVLRAPKTARGEISATGLQPAPNVLAIDRGPFLPVALIPLPRHGFESTSRVRFGELPVFIEF
jgi:hypothetical protein